MTWKERRTISMLLTVIAVLFAALLIVLGIRYRESREEALAAKDGGAAGLSGSGALAVGSDLMAAYGPDSYIGRCAAVMLGSTETTFYVIAVYFGAAGIKRARRAVPAALCADLVGFVMAALTVRLFVG